MGLDDLFHFDAPSYAHKAAQMSTPDLRRREEVKIRQFLAGSCSVGLGVAAAAPTGGISLGFVALAGRNMDVAMKKLEIIQAELTRRGVPLHDKLSTADRLVPIVGGVTALGVGMGMEGAFLDSGGAAATGIETTMPEMTTGEIIAANVVGGRAAAWAREALESAMDKKRLDEVRQTIGCTRLLGFGWRWLECDGCEAVIDRGLYARKF